MKVKAILIFFVVVFIINYLLNMILSLGQDLPYIFILSIVTTILFSFLMIMRGRWSK